MTLLEIADPDTKELLGFAETLADGTVRVVNVATHTCGPREPAERDELIEAVGEALEKIVASDFASLLQQARIAVDAILKSWHVSVDAL